MKKTLISIFSVLIFFCLIYMHLTTFIERIGHLALLLLVLLPCIILIIFGIIYSWRKKNHLSLIIGLLLFIINILSWLSSYQIVLYEVRITEKNAQVITQALEKYHEEKNAYPSSLIELKPLYLSSLPKRYFLLLIDTDFEYFLEKDGTYVLYYDFSGACPMAYYSNDKTWYPQPKG
jgi:Zn-dependent protease with chaperone function